MFSIVVPVWNAQATLRRCVRSILDQSYGSFELLLVDDGSADGAIERLDVDDDRIRVLRQPNAGPAEARNRGLAAASADWIAFLDADDLWFNDHLEELDVLRAAVPHAGLIGTAYLDSASDGTLPARHENAPERRPIHYFEEVGRGRQPLWIGSCAVHRAAYEQQGGFRTSWRGDDNEFIARIALHHPVAASTRATAIWVHGTGGITERTFQRWKDDPVTDIAEISPAVATVVAHRAHADAADLPPGIGAYVDQYVRWWLLGAFHAGDVMAVRRLGRLFEGRRTMRDRLLIWSSYAPPRLLLLLRRMRRAARKLMSARAD